MSIETCPSCGMFMSKKEVDYSLSHFGNKNCKACDKEKYTISSDGLQKKKVLSAKVPLTPYQAQQKFQRLDTQSNPFQTKNIGFIIGAILAFFIPLVGPIISIILFMVWRARSKKK